jgi:subtilase family serine protease
MAAGSSATFVAAQFYPRSVGLVTEVQLDPQVAVLESNEGNNFVTK